MKNLSKIIVTLLITILFFSCQKEESVQPKKPSTSYTYKTVNFIFTPQPGYYAGGVGTVYYRINNATTYLMSNDVWNNSNTSQQSYQSFSCPVGSVLNYNFGTTNLSLYRPPLLSASIESNILFINSTDLSGSFSVN